MPSRTFEKLVDFEAKSIVETVICTTFQYNWLNTKSF